MKLLCHVQHFDTQYLAFLAYVEDYPVSNLFAVSKLAFVEFYIQVYRRF